MTNLERSCHQLCFRLAAPPSSNLALFIRNPREETIGGCLPVTCESWLDVRAGHAVSWPNGRIDTVIAVELWEATPSPVREADIISGRDWELTGLGSTGKPVLVHAPSRRD